jgi:hypothetical protein
VNGPTETDPRIGTPELTLHALGVACTVEARGNLAIVTLAPGERGLEDVGVRRRALAALRTHGFSHVAVEPSDALTE